MASVIFKILKGVTTTMIFATNGNSNDFFVAYFFFSSSFNGLVYLKLCGFEMPAFGDGTLNPIEAIIENKIRDKVVYW